MNDLRELIRAVAARHPKDQFEKIVQAVVDQTTSKQLRAFYAQALRPVVADVLREDRNTAITCALSDHPVRRKPNQSAKVNAVRSWWRQMLASSVHTEHGSKLLGDCDRDDVEYLIKERQAHIANVESYIALYRRLLDMMDEHGVTRVRDLPELQRESA